jgi:CRISPR/Cas system-associated exonuclease Cas4 (RecB family)
MSQREEQEHSNRLDDIVRDLRKIKEAPVGVRDIIREGVYQGRVIHTKFPDLVLVYNSTAVPVEYKRSSFHREAALAQLGAGVRFVESKLHLRCDHARFVYYDYCRGQYISETVQRGAFQ